MKKITEQKSRIVEGLLDFIWKKTMSGKSKALIAMYDHDPQVADAIKGIANARTSLQKAIENSKKLTNK